MPFPQIGDHSVDISPERKVVEDLFMQYRVERAVRRMGKIALLILASFSLSFLLHSWRFLRRNISNVALSAMDRLLMDSRHDGWSHNNPKRR